MGAASGPRNCPPCCITYIGPAHANWTRCPLELDEPKLTDEANIAADQSTFWAVWNLASPDDLRATLETLPLYDYMDIQVSPLAEPPVIPFASQEVHAPPETVAGRSPHG